MKAGAILAHTDLRTKTPQECIDSVKYMIFSIKEPHHIDRFFQLRELKKHLIWCSKEMKQLHRNILDSMLSDELYLKVETTVQRCLISSGNVKEYLTYPSKFPCTEDLEKALRDEVYFAAAPPQFKCFVMLWAIHPNSFHVVGHLICCGPYMFVVDPCLTS